jgi:enoyl-CoA hydratase
MAMSYADYRHLRFDLRGNGALLVTIDRPPVNATDTRLHRELSEVWQAIGADAQVRVVLVTGAGRHFSVGGDHALLEQLHRDPAALMQGMREAADIVYRMADLEQPIVSAINGTAVGAGLAVALMADISIMSETATLTDGHLRLGVAAGDHAVMLWPLLCGMAKAKLYLLTSRFIDGKEAERIGLVSACAPADRLMDTAWEIANELAAGSQPALRFTKRALNQWLRLAGPAFDHSLALEMLTFLGPDCAEGLRALRERRPPKFPSAAT